MGCGEVLMSDLAHRSGWDYFSEEELTCRCGCGQQNMSPVFMAALVAMRREAGFPFHVSSAYRCREHNLAISPGTGRTGPHTTGKAVDVVVAGNRAHKVIEMAMKHGMTGIGVKQKGPHGERFIHLDMLSGHEAAGLRPWVWSY